MEKINDDILRIILSFLSAEEKIKIREVSKDFKNVVSQRYLNEYRLNWLMQKFVQREDKLEDELNLLTRHIYHKRVENRIHPYFSRQRPTDKCITDRCQNERLGNIYIKGCKLAPTCHGRGGNIWACNKRKITYCVHCFEIWMVRCSIVDLNLSS